jgi:phosphoadenosine phosphosulfate reductase
VLLHLVSVIAPQRRCCSSTPGCCFPKRWTISASWPKAAPLRHPHHPRPPDPHRFEDPDGTLHQFNDRRLLQCAQGRTAGTRAGAALTAGSPGASGFRTPTAGARLLRKRRRLPHQGEPLAHWGREDLEEYMVNNRLPRHPLVAKGYPSIGCAPCTSPVARRRPARGPLARAGQDRMRHPFHRRQARANPKGAAA